jgi:hypothetical protein
MRIKLARGTYNRQTDAFLWLRNFEIRLSRHKKISRGSKKDSTMAATTSTSKDDGKRRGKTDTINNKKKDSSAKTAHTKANFNEHLERAQSAVLQNKVATETLHAQWRTSLKRMSYMLLIISLHQSQGPTQACLTDIKALNQHYSSLEMSDDVKDKMISGIQAIVLVLKDSVVAVLGLVMAASLTYFTSMDPHGDFTSAAYMLAVASVPPIMSLHFNWNNPNRNEKNESFYNKSCVDMELLDAAGVEPVDRLHGFPVVLAYFVVLTVSYFFMDWQRQKQVQNGKMVLQLQKDMEDQAKLKQEEKGGSKKKK